MKLKKFFLALTCGIAAVSMAFSQNRLDSTGNWYVKYRGDVVTICGTTLKTDNLVVPSEVDGATVTNIADSAFQDGEFKTVKLPDTITKIGYNAFRSCENLVSINIPKNVTIIEEYVFKYCSSLKEIEIPSGVKAILDDAFYYCESLEKVTLPEGLLYIGESAFEYCTSLKKVTIPVSVRIIRDYAFDDCENLDSIIIPRCTRLDDYSCVDNQTLVYVFRGSDAHEEMEDSSREYLFAKEGSYGDVPEYDDYDEVEREYGYSDYSDYSYDYDDYDDYGYDYDDEEEVEVTMEQIEALKQEIITRETDMSYESDAEESDSHYYLDGHNYRVYVDSEAEVPYVSQCFIGDDGRRFIVVIYKGSTSRARMTFEYLGYSISGEEVDYTYSEEEMDEIYNEFYLEDFTVRDTVDINGNTYEIVLTELNS